MMTRSLFALTLPWICALGASGCNDEPQQDEQPVDASIGCDANYALPELYQPVEEVSAGTVVDEDLGALREVHVDATAGGFGSSTDEAFVYLRFTPQGAQKVEISDVEAMSSTAWDIALKRYVIRVNSGDSGDGDVLVTSVKAVSLADVTTVPSSFAADDWATEECELVEDAIGGPLTAVGEWYNSDAGTLTPKNAVYVLQRDGGDYIKFRVVTYYGDDDDSTRSAYYRLQWSALAN